MLTLAYITARKEPMIQWFFDSLHRECGGDYSDIKIVVVDSWFDEPGRVDNFKSLARGNITHVCAKPSVWRGKHRLTKVDYHAGSNARNTAVCLAPDGWIAFVDDLSVLIPGYLKAVRKAMEGGYIVSGAYRKVKNIVIENGEVKSYTDYPGGNDHRIPHGSKDGAVHCHPQWLYGYSAMAIEAILKTNGWPELSDSTGIGLEDCLLGTALGNNGYQIHYDVSMMVWESYEHHYSTDVAGIRMDKNRGKVVESSPGVMIPDEKGHALIRLTKDAKRFDNYFGPEGISGLRSKVLSGESFPIPTEPTVDFYDGQPVVEL